ncbi:MAG: Dabb family protein [Chthoniobacteraceae bacterium]
MKTLLALASLALFTMSSLAADGPVFHIVHFKFKSDATPAQIAQVEKDFAALKGKIDVVQSLEWGTDISPEKLSDGFTHCWVLTFKNEKDRDTYIADPAHQAFVATLKDVLEKPFVVDFIPRK